jgi:DNA polymerase III sliding clamp (beta) subunit (PCNA family)
MKATFENATIADSVAKAARVAPTKGQAYDKASGIVIQLNPADNTVTLKSTNLEVYYLEIVDAIEVEGEGSWRLPASVLSSLMAKLPIGSGKNLTMEQVGNEVHIKTGRTVAKFRNNEVQYYPQWDPFDPNLLEVVSDLGARIKQVDWAAEDNVEAHYAGIHLDGTYAWATDTVRLARVPCEAEPIYKPITIPAGILNPVLANLRDVAIGLDEGQFILMPDPSTQIRTVIYGHEYPIERIMKVFDKSWPDMFKVKKAALLEIMDRAAVFVAKERVPHMDVIIGKGELAVMCTDQEVGLLGDAIGLDGYADHKRSKMVFTPKNLQQALTAAPSEEIEFWYDKEEPGFPAKINGGSGYEAVIMPRRSQTNG